MSVNSPVLRRGLIISAPTSGSGKTTVALGLMRAFQRRGLTVQSFKSGPDYIDTGFHHTATRRPGFNLDTWSMHARTLESLIENATGDADISIVEGAMGLFDGAPAPGQYACGTTADLAALTGWPVLLVIDVARQAQTAAAVVKGCATYRDDIRICSVILNNVASPRHEHLIAPAIEKLGIPVIASLPRRNDLALPERHLGLVQATENSDLENKLDTFANMLESSGAIDKVKKLSKQANLVQLKSSSDGINERVGLPPPGQRIALAQDESFSFAYSHLIESWREQGAQILRFSPLRDEPPAPNADAVWLSGGYPELHAAKLASAQKFKNGVRILSSKGIPIHGECGGYMVLGRGLIDKQGDRHEMLGLLSLETSFERRKLHLGYRKANLIYNSSLGRNGASVFGHEFHYATILSNDDEPLAEILDAQGSLVHGGGSVRANVTGTFFHVIDRQRP